MIGASGMRALFSGTVKRAALMGVVDRWRFADGVRCKSTVKPAARRLHPSAKAIIALMLFVSGAPLPSRADEAREEIRRRGDAAVRAHQYTVAETRYTELLRLSDGDWGEPGCVLVEDGLRQLIEVWRAQNQLRHHEEQWRAELATKEARHGAHDPELIRALQALGLAANARGDYRNAISAFDRIASILDRVRPGRHATTQMRVPGEVDDGVLYQQFLVFLHLAAGDIEGARRQIAFRDVAIRTVGNGVGSGSDAELDNLYDEIVCAWVPLLDGNAALAANRLGPVANKTERLLGNDHPNTAAIFEAYATASKEAGKNVAAAGAREHAQLVLRRAALRH